ncbi:regulatory protein, luxR family [Propionibacterium cyclohexanicum]|uniref:Regulatory protein, luxR family n=1 Tax=Propionibacterium cyclohexanicum TaxID=64702 RepID=A0A1H9RNH2_9ACTN|nr:LuxR C-terminal-related transcriptional regulator [Propionibacterium cyclohexanicum]SER74078.1 regulatory protein, luxR family [Propionibacterium cyclohexanicum]
MTGQSSELSSSVGALIGAGLAGSGGAHAWSIDVVLAARNEDRSEWTRAERAGFTAAATRALAFSGHFAEAVKAADEAREYLREAAGGADAGYLAKCHCVLAESYLLSGHGRACAELAQSAIDQAEQAADADALVEGNGLMSAALALNGRFAAARSCWTQIERTGVLKPGVLPWYVAFSRGFVASDRADRGLLGDIIAETAVSGPTATGPEILDNAVASLLAMWSALAGGDARGAVAEAESFVSGVFISGCPPLFRALALRTEAEALLQLGQARNAATALAGLHSLPDHNVCFEWLRAAAHLQLNEPREALRVTERCLRVDSMHSPRTMPLVRVRRAAALELLGLHELADTEFSRGIHLCHTLGWVTSVRGLSPEIVGVLVHRLNLNEPSFAARVTDKIREDLEHGAGPATGTSFIRLTPREKAIAQLLSGNLALTDIADELRISANTAKTHIRHLYRKLGVSSRAEAKARLLETGLVEGPEQRPAAGEPGQSG